MRYTKTDTTLTIYVDEHEQSELLELRRDDPDYFKSDDAMYDFFESFIINSDLVWVFPDDTDDLTEAPMLGELGSETTNPGGLFGDLFAGWDDKTKFYIPIVNRWAFMDYAVRSVLDDLAENGHVFFRN